ncbi:MAG: ATP-binding protein [Maioricimonas sp. JB049]
MSSPNQHASSVRLSPALEIDERADITVRAVISLRWVAVAGQLATILVVDLFLHVLLPMQALLVVLLATAALNAVLSGARHAWPPRRHEGPNRWMTVIGVTMLFDLVALTLLLYFTGGMTNPFSLFYLVNLVLAAVVLPRLWVWGLNVIALGCVAFLVLRYEPLLLLEADPEPGAPAGGGFDVLSTGSLIAYATCATVIVLFSTRVSSQLRRQESRVRELADLRARSERLESLGTLAAGAAHELATPLSTIAVITQEVERELSAGKLTDQTISDIQTVRSELNRCRDILDRMSTDAGLAIGETLMKTTVGELVEEAVDGAGDPQAIHVSFANGAADVPLEAPLHGLAQAIRGIMKNAVDASGPQPRVECRVSASGERFTLQVQDSGTGMDAETLRRIGEPFFTTKDPGQGTGLGVFLARNIIERLGGTLAFSSTPGEGTCVTIELPTHLPAPGQAGDDDLAGHGQLF